MGNMLALRTAAGRVIRREVARQGIRTIRSNGTPDQSDGSNQQAGILGAIATVWDWTKKAGGFLIDLGRFIGFGIRSLADLVGFLSQSSSFLWNFNWNLPDETLEQEIQAANQMLAGISGGFLGQSLGWLACGVGGAAVIGVFSPALGLSVLKDVAEEGYDELSSSLYALVSVAARSYNRIGFLSLYMNARRAYYWLKDRDAGLPDFSKRKPWSFAIAFEDWTQQFSPPWQDFLEEFREEFAEACTESGFVVAQSLESHLAELGLIREATNRPRTVEIELRRGTAG